MGACEVDQALFIKTAKFCVYLHSRPDGSVFYVGKGKRSRAYEFSPSRRSRFHSNIVSKYGRGNIGVRVMPVMCELEATLLEVTHIKMWRAKGQADANFTDGGEGVSGRKPSEKALAALDRGRKKWSEKKFTPETMAAILAGAERGRQNRKEWEMSEQGKEQLRKLGETGKAVLHRERSVECVDCRQSFITRSAKARCCGRLCEQRHRRKRDANEQQSAGGY